MGASAGGIRAGKAFVELYAKNNLAPGLTKAAHTLRSWGLAIGTLGAGLTAAGSSIVGVFLAGTQQAQQYASQIVDLSARTGIGVEALQELSYAAEQTGASQQDLAAGLRGMQRSVAAAARGSAQAQASLERLGLSVDDLAGQSPDRQFALIADRIAGIQDPAERTAAAMALFGRGGTALLPTLAAGSAGLDELRQRARDLGLVMSGEDAAAAEAFGDDWSTIQQQLRGVWRELGSAVIPVLQELVEPVMHVVRSVGTWIRENRQLVATIFKVAVGVVAAGAALTVLGGLLWGAGTALAGIAVILPTVAGLLAGAFLAVVSPVGLAIAGVVALGAAIVYYSGLGGQALAWLNARFGQLAADARTTLGGISDAIAAGDLALAMRIAWLQIQMVWVRGTAGLHLAWLALRNALLNAWTSTWLGLRIAMIAGWAALQTLWIGGAEFILTTWARVTGAITAGWHTAVGFLRKAWARFKSWFSESNLDAELAAIDAEVTAQQVRAAVDSERSVADVRAGADAQRRAVAGEAVTAISADTAAAEAAMEGREAEVAGVEHVRDAGLGALRAEWQSALAEASAARQQAGIATLGDRSLGGFDPDAAGAGLSAAEGRRVSSVGTFSAAAVGGLVGGTGDRIARATEQSARALEAIKEHTRDAATYSD